MAQLGDVLFCALTMAGIWTLIGGPIAARIAPPLLSWWLAPAVGWSIHGVLALPLCGVLGLSQRSVLITTALFALAALAALWHLRLHGSIQRPAVASVLAVVAVVTLALVPMAAIFPKGDAGEIALSAPIFDHSKIALITEMMRNGVPASNPFFSEIGTPERISYSYLWHFSAAVMALATGVSGWEADAALTWFTAFASLLVVTGFATWISGRYSAALFAVAIAATGSARPVFEWTFGEADTRDLLGWATGFGGWLFQVSWAPQHVAAATSVVLACYVLMQMPSRRDPVLIVVLALLVAASFESSTWAGLVFVIAAIALSSRILWSLPASERASFLIRVAVAGALAGAMTALFVYDQVTTIAIRDVGSPIAFDPLPVLGDAVPEKLRAILDLPAYWLIYLPLELPASYPAGIVMLLLLIFAGRTCEEYGEVGAGFALLAASSLIVSWLMISDLGGNNDLSWRGALPAVLLLMAFAAAGLARWTAGRSALTATLGIIGLLIGVPRGLELFHGNVAASPSASAATLTATPAMWESVRRFASPQERVANNPLFLGDATPWPVNISWALLADRRSCYAGYELAIPFAPVSASRRLEVDAGFKRVFAGNPADGDVQQLASRHGCDVVVVTAQDGAWSRDPFAASDAYQLIERADAWRIYRRTGAQGR